MVFIAPYRYLLDLGAHGSTELVLPDGKRLERPYFGFFGVGEVGYDRGPATAPGFEVRCTPAEEDRWRATEAACLAELREINADLLGELDSVQADLVAPRPHALRAASMSEASQRADQAVDRCYSRMTVLAERHRSVWDEVNQRLAEPD